MVATDRLRAAADIRRTVGERCAASGGALVVHARLRGDDEPARAAVVAGRRVGGAVQRNRAKRRLRAALRGTTVPTGVDLVVTAKPTVEPDWPTLVAEVDQTVRQAIHRARQRAKGAR